MTEYYRFGKPYVKTGEHRPPLEGEKFLGEKDIVVIASRDHDPEEDSWRDILREKLPFEDSGKVSNFKQDSDNVSNFKHIVAKMTEVYKDKNSDYGDSFHKLYERYGLQSAVIRLYDKMYRIENLVTSANKVKNESVKDTLMDLANYAIMTIMEIDKNGCDSEDKDDTF